MVDCGFFEMRGGNRIYIEIGLRQRVSATEYFFQLRSCFLFSQKIP